MRAYADEVKAIMRTNSNLRGINDNWNESVKVLRLDVDQDKARALGVSSQSIALAARTINSGTTLGQYREGDNLVDIVLRQPLEERNAITDLANAYVPLLMLQLHSFSRSALVFLTAPLGIAGGPVHCCC